MSDVETVNVVESTEELAVVVDAPAPVEPAQLVDLGIRLAKKEIEKKE